MIGPPRGCRNMYVHAMWAPQMTLLYRRYTGPCAHCGEVGYRIPEMNSLDLYTPPSALKAGQGTRADVLGRWMRSSKRPGDIGCLLSVDLWLYVLALSRPRRRAEGEAAYVLQTGLGTWAGGYPCQGVSYRSDWGCEVQRPSKSRGYAWRNLATMV